MSALRTGVDLAEVDDVRAALERFGARYLDRVYTPAEQGECRHADGTPDPRRLAVRFAAKEAAAKLLQPGDTALPWTTIEVLEEGRGAVGVHWRGAAGVLAEAAGITSVGTSVTHERGTVAAVAVARVARRPPG